MDVNSYFARPVRISPYVEGVHMFETTGPQLVRLDFISLNRRLICFDSHDGEPNEHARVNVNGVERNFWVEFAGPFRKRPALRDVCGVDLRPVQPIGLTTDDGRQYLFLNRSDIQEEVVAAFPAGSFRAVSAAVETAIAA